MANEEKKRRWYEEAGYESFDAMLTIKAPKFGLDFLGQHHPLDAYRFCLTGDTLPVVEVAARQMWTLGSVPALERALALICRYLEGRREGS